MAVPVSPPEPLSPELVLVDARLAIDARACLSDPDDTLARLEPDPVTSQANERAAALRRITELADLEESPGRRGTFRVAKLSAALATWSTAATLVDTQFYHWSSLL